MGVGSGGVGSMPLGSTVPAAQEVFDPGDGVASVQGPELAKQTSHVAHGLALLIEQFKGKPKIAAVLRGWLQQAQELECVFMEDLRLERSVATAVGAQLDGLGDIVGEERAGRTDADYRLAISARIRANNSGGRHEELLVIARLLLGDAPEVVLTELYPAGFELESTSDPLAVNLDALVSALSVATGAGIRGSFIHAEAANVFQFSSTSAIEVDANLGFSDETEVAGGTFAGASAL